MLATGKNIRTRHPNSPSLDQINPQGGYTTDNVQVVAWWYNVSKQQFTDEEVLAFLPESHNNSEFIRHEACEDCGSSDAKAVYSDHHSHCFSCNKTRSEDEQKRLVGHQGSTARHPVRGGAVVATEVALGDTIKPLLSRQITEETCRHFNYTVGNYGNRRAQFAPYYDEAGKLVAAKLRFPGKDFAVIGSMKDALPFGAQACSRTGRQVILTEGEIDAMSMSQVQGLKWPVVSVANGAASARKFVAKNLGYFLKFEKVVVMFDNDDPGQKAALEVAEVLGPRAHIARLPLNDPNAMLKAGRTEELIRAMWQAEQYRPEGLVQLDDIREKIIEGPVDGLPWPFETLTKLTYGRRRGEIYILGAGTGVGKTDFFTEIVEQTVNELGLPVGLFFLEQEPVETALRVLGKFANKRFHVPNDPDEPRDSDWTKEGLTEAFDKVNASGKLHFYDSFGVNDWDIVKERIRYLRHAEGVEDFFIDHLTALAAWQDDERKALEVIMSDMGGLVKELGITLYLISHLATPDGKPHEEGGRVMIRHLKGSRSVGFWSHFILAMERDQQAEDPVLRQTTTFRVLKDRYTGQATGKTFFLAYDANTGRLYETDKPVDGELVAAFSDEGVAGEKANLQVLTKTANLAKRKDDNKLEPRGRCDTL